MAEFEWDDKKAADAYRKRGITFKKTTEVFKDQFRIEEPNHFESEERWQITGMTSKSCIVVCSIHIYNSRRWH